MAAHPHLPATYWQPYDLPPPCGMVTAPITEWITRASGLHMSDVLLGDGHVVRACSPELAAMYLREQGGVVLPRRN